MENQSQNSPLSSQPNIPPAVPIQPALPSQELPPQETSGGAFSPRNLIKLLIGLLAVGFVLFIIFAFVLPNMNKKEEKVEISFWGLFDEPAVFQNVIADFEKENPSIKVRYEKQNIKDYREKLTTRIAQGTGPDIFRFHNTWQPIFSDQLLPIPSDVITKDEFKNTYYPVVSEDLVREGAMYGVPLGIDILTLFVNPEIFSQAGLMVPNNWNDFVNTSRGLTVKDATGKIVTSGAAFGTFDNVTRAPDIISLLMIQDGVDLKNLSPKNRVSEALSFYTAFAIPEGNVWDASQDKDLLAFSKGNLGMYFGYYWDYFAIKASSPDLKFELRPVPQLSFPNIEIASYYPLGTSIKGKNQKETLLFLKFLARKDVQEKIFDEQARARGFGEPPARVDLAGKLTGTPLENFVLGAKNATSSYFVSETFDNAINTELSALLREAVNTILGGGSADSAADSLISGFPQVFDKYSKKQN